MKKSVTTTESLLDGLAEPDRQKIEQALAIVTQFPDDESYQRPKGVEVAAILKDLHVDLSTLLAALLSDPRVNKLSPVPDLKLLFGTTVAAIVQDVNWLNTIAVYSLEMTNQPSQTEILRRMLLSMTHDVRAVLIKLAFRIKRLRGLPKESYDMRRFIAQETLDIYAPLANRMGIHQLKWELEDLAFRYLQPQSYRHIAKSLNDNRIARESCVFRFTQLLREALQQAGVHATISGRPKHIYSIWKKMQRKQAGIEELYDLLAVRIIVDNLQQCYTALGIVHSHWQTIPKEFDDYIANPKENGYQSLHTVILDADGNRIEVQIRTQAMHEFAELGVAAHWAYKEGGKHDAATEKSINSLRKLLEHKDDDETLAESFRSELFHDRVYILTPKGHLIDLVKNSTPLDFAYAIHTEIGHRCRGAKVNGRIVPLTYTLSSGEQVEILTAKEGGPNRNWLDVNLGYLKSPTAISKVKSWFRNQEHSRTIATGKAILDKESRRLGVTPPDLAELTKHFKQKSEEQLLEAIGRSDINTQQLTAFFKIPEFETTQAKLQHASDSKSIISVAGIDNVLTNFAHCCTPVSGDEIIGYISLKKGITVHRKDCSNITRLTPDKQLRLVNVTWSQDKKVRYLVPITIQAFSMQNVLSDVSHALAQARIYIAHATMTTHPDFTTELNLTIQIENTDQLSQILHKISCLPNVIDAKRRA